MALITSYLVTVKNLPSFFNSLLAAQAPKAFTQKFLESLEFKSTNDRLYIGLLKGLGFLDANGAPTTRYFSFLDQSQSKIILADAIREAYEDLFSIQVNAHKLSRMEVKNKLKTLTQGKYSDVVLDKMASTFVTLVAYAAWDKQPDKMREGGEHFTEKTLINDEEKEEPTPDINEDAADKNPSKFLNPELHYNIQIQLPESRDQAVYDVLFKSLRKHLF